MLHDLSNVDIVLNNLSNYSTRLILLIKKIAFYREWLSLTSSKHCHIWSNRQCIDLFGDGTKYMYELERNAFCLFVFFRFIFIIMTIFWKLISQNKNIFFFL